MSNISNTSRADPTLHADSKPKRRLPTIELIKFSGAYKTFPRYIDMYNSLVYSDETLSDMDTFSYLLGSLSGVALALVQCLPFEAKNYQRAYSSLIERFQNKRVRATS